MPQEEHEQGLLPGRQVESRTGPLGAAGREIETHVAIAKHRVRRALLAAGHGAHAGEQFLEGKRLAKVIVRAAVQAADAIGDSVARGEEEHRRGVPRLTKASQQRQTVLARKPPVEQHDVPRPALQSMPAAVAVRGCLDRETFLAQAADDEVGYGCFVFDYKDSNAHLALVSVLSSRPRPARFIIADTAN